MLEIYVCLKVPPLLHIYRSNTMKRRLHGQFSFRHLDRFYSEQLVSSLN